MAGRRRRGMAANGGIARRVRHHQAAAGGKIGIKSGKWRKISIEAK
jgi:hypothetical protein